MDGNRVYLSLQDLSIYYLKFGSWRTNGIKYHLNQDGTSLVASFPKSNFVNPDNWTGPGGQITEDSYCGDLFADMLAEDLNLNKSIFSSTSQKSKEMSRFAIRTLIRAYVNSIEQLNATPGGRSRGLVLNKFSVPNPAALAPANFQSGNPKLLGHMYALAFADSVHDLKVAGLQGYLGTGKVQIEVLFMTYIQQVFKNTTLNYNDLNPITQQLINGADDENSVLCNNAAFMQQDLTERQKESPVSKYKFSEIISDYEKLYGIEDPTSGGWIFNQASKGSSFKFMARFRDAVIGAQGREAELGYFANILNSMQNDQYFQQKWNQYYPGTIPDPRMRTTLAKKIVDSEPNPDKSSEYANFAIPSLSVVSFCDKGNTQPDHPRGQIKKQIVGIVRKYWNSIFNAYANDPVTLQMALISTPEFQEFLNSVNIDFSPNVTIHIWNFLTVSFYIDDQTKKPLIRLKTAGMTEPVTNPMLSPDAIQKRFKYGRFALTDIIFKFIGDFGILLYSTTRNIFCITGDRLAGVVYLFFLIFTATPGGRSKIVLEYDPDTVFISNKNDGYNPSPDLATTFAQFCLITTKWKNAYTYISEAEITPCNAQKFKEYLEKKGTDEYNPEEFAECETYLSSVYGRSMVPQESPGGSVQTYNTTQTWDIINGQSPEPSMENNANMNNDLTVEDFISNAMKYMESGASTNGVEDIGTLQSQYTEFIKNINKMDEETKQTFLMLGQELKNSEEWDQPRQSATKSRTLPPKTTPAQPILTPEQVVENAMLNARTLRRLARDRVR